MHVTPNDQMLQALGSGPARPEPVREASNAIATEAVRQPHAAPAVPPGPGDESRAVPGRAGSRINIVV